MYRRYEDPYKLEKELEELKKLYEESEENGECEEMLYSLSCDINELEERVNFAWQDLYEEDY